MTMIIRNTHSARIRVAASLLVAAACTSVYAGAPTKPAAPTSVVAHLGSSAAKARVAGNTPTQSHVMDGSQAFYAREGQLNDELSLLQIEQKISKIKDSLAGGPVDATIHAPSSVIVAPPAAMSPQTGTPGAPPPAAERAASLTVPVPIASPEPSTIHVRSIVGVHGSYWAEISDDGVSARKTVGDDLSGHWRIVSISPTSVRIARGRARRTLRVGD
jgi:type IV pilus biogenesis protein PilP